VRWAEYAEASRRLAEIRGQEQTRQSHAQQRAAAGRAAVEQLQRRLAAQRDHLAGVATRLGEPQPHLDGTARTGLTDPDEAIRRAVQAIDQADVEARQAEERGMRPVLLPTMSTKGRNGLVYAAAAFGMWLVSCGLYSFSSRSGSASIGLLLWSLCGLPAMAFFAAYVVISIFGRAKVQSLGQVDHSARLGGLICFGGMLGAWIVFLAATAFLRA
jgi:multidrug efflux pump subunit AcrA (membrane-fusion protein)